MPTSQDMAIFVLTTTTTTTMMTTTTRPITLPFALQARTTDLTASMHPPSTDYPKFIKFRFSCFNSLNFNIECKSLHWSILYHQSSLAKLYCCQCACISEIDDLYLISGIDDHYQSITNNGGAGVACGRGLSWRGDFNLPRRREGGS